MNNNTVTGTDANEMTDSVKAYYMANNIQLQVGCNVATDVGRGYEFYGTQPGTWWHDNNMTDNIKGFVLNHSLIGPQADPYYYARAIKDHWLPSGSWANPQTYVLGTPGGLSSPLYIENNPTDKPTINGGFFVYNYTAICALINATSVPIDICKPPVIYHRDLTPEAIGCFETIAEKTVAYVDDSAVRTWMAQYGLWEYANYDSTIIDSSVVGNSFVNLAINSRYAYLTNIEDALVSGDTATANWYITNPTAPLVGNGTYFDTTTGVIIADDSVNDYIVANYRLFYTMYMNYLNDSLSAKDSIVIANMAGLCPNIYGTVVYQARSLYSAVFNELGVWNDDFCYPTDSSGGRYGKNGKGNTLQNDDGQRYTLYPNPNNGSFTLTQLLYDNLPINIKVWNEIGSCVYKGIAIFDQGTKSLQLGENNAPGLYFVNIIDSKGKIFTLNFVVK